MRSSQTFAVLPQCPWCMNPLTVIWVHGHGQCGHCGINMEPCCDGRCEALSERVDVVAEKQKDP